MNVTSRNLRTMVQLYINQCLIYSIQNCNLQRYVKYVKLLEFPRFQNDVAMVYLKGNGTFSAAPNPRRTAALHRLEDAEQAATSGERGPRTWGFSGLIYVCKIGSG